MGRPIKKKFFANLNSPYQNQATGGPTGEGGESIVSVTINTAGSYTSALPSITFGTPDLFLGVQATGVVHGNALSAVATAAGTGYNLSDVLTQTAGGTGSYATWNVTGLTVVGITLKNGGTANDVGDEFAFNNPNFAVAMRVRVTASNAGVATAVAIVDGGRLITGALPSATDAGGFTRVQTVGATDMNGQSLEVNFTAWGVATVAAVTQGDYTAITGGANATSVTPSGGTGATLTITYGVSGVEITNAGSNYISVADAAATFSTGAATGTAVLGAVRDNGLAAYAYIINGNQGVLVDIMKQESSRRYLVKERGGVQGQCRLVAKNPNDLLQGEMILIATDANGSTYWVIKLTARRAILQQRTMSGSYAFADTARAGWTTGAASTGFVSIASV
jgi:hypothetical protein